MGFMTLQCGLGAFAIALLHLIAHSLYKARAFLSSGSVVEVSSMSISTPPRILPVLASLVSALGLYAAIGWLFGVFVRDEAAVLTLGAILVLGISMLMVPTMHGADSTTLVARTLLVATLATLAYFVLESPIVRLTAAALPGIPAPDTWGFLVMGLAVVSFSAVTVLQSLPPRWVQRPAWRAARVHLANGLYVNAWFNRLIGAQRRDEGGFPAAPTA